MKEKRKKYLDLFFDDGDSVVYGATTYSRDSTLYSDWMCEGKPYTQYDKTGKVKKLDKVQNFFVVNPMCVGTTRASVNVSKFRSFLLEIDIFLFPEDKKELISDYEEALRVSLTIQLKLWAYAIKEYGFPTSGLLYSANKSYHGPTCLEVPISNDNPYVNGKDNIERYKILWWRLALRLTEIAKEFCKINKIVMGDFCKIRNIFTEKEIKKGSVVCDSQCSEPARFTRFPEVTRIDNKKYQSIIAVKKRISFEKITEFLKDCPEFKPVNKHNVVFNVGVSSVLGNSYDRFEFLAACPESIKKQINFFKNNSSSDGMHDPLLCFYLSLFGKFKNISVQYALDLCEDLVYEHLRKAGYPKDRLYNNTLTSTWEYVNGKSN